MDTRLAMICGTDIPVPSCQLVLHQPTLEEISFIGESDFFSGAQTLCLHKTMFIEDKILLMTQIMKITLLIEKKYINLKI